MVYLTSVRHADYLRHSQAEATEVLEGSIDFHENTLSKICCSCRQLTDYQEVSGQLPAEGKTVTDSSTAPPWAVQRDHRPNGVRSW